VLTLATMQRQRVWHDPVALWQDTARGNPAAFDPAAGLGEALRQTGRLVEAEAATRRALLISEGTHGDTWATLALILDGQGRTADAREALDKALAVDPRLADPHARVAVLAMDKATAADLLELLQRLQPPARTGRP
jgi:Flp pilus assembly protein TadD